MMEGSGGKEKLTVAMEKSIQEYLKKVEKNLKGFTREAKDSILIEIEEHIREKIQEGEKGEILQKRDRSEEGRVGRGNEVRKEAGSRGEEQTSGRDREIDVSKILEDFGTPEEVAKDYTPVVRMSQWKPNLFLVVSCLVSIYLLIAIYDGLQEFMEEYETNEDVYVYFWIAFLAISTLSFNITYLKYPDSMNKYSSIIFLTNFLQFLTFAILVPLEYFIASEVEELSLPSIVEIGETNVLLSLLYAILFISFSLYLSSIGSSYVSRDIADGISPKTNLSMKLLPALLLVGIALIARFYSSLSDGMDLYFSRNRFITYVSFTLMIALTVTIAIIIFMRYHLSIKIFIIRNEIFHSTIIALILISAIGAAAITSNMFDPEDISKDETEKPYGTIVAHDDSLYSWHLGFDAGPGYFIYQFELFDWSNSRLIACIDLDLPSGYYISEIDIDVKFSGPFVHIHVPLVNYSVKAQSSFLVI